jgi:predicted acetyltransferase
MDNSDKYTYSILTIQEKKDGSININSKLEELKIALQDAKAKNIENIIINVKQKNKISRRIRFEKEVANGI